METLTINEKNYNICFDLYNQINIDFYSIENSKFTIDNFIIKQTLDNIKQLEVAYNKISLLELQSLYNKDEMVNIQSNINHFKETAHFVKNMLIAIQLFDKLSIALSKYIKFIEWDLIATTEKQAIIKIANYLTSNENVVTYKTICNNIIKGTFNQKSFYNLFSSIISQLLKNVKKVNAKNALQYPPEMWDKKTKTNWEHSIEYNKNMVKEEVESVFYNLN